MPWLVDFLYLACVLINVGNACWNGVGREHHRVGEVGLERHDGGDVCGWIQGFNRGDALGHGNRGEVVRV